jgi:hypothetical protein
VVTKKTVTITREGEYVNMTYAKVCEMPGRSGRKKRCKPRAMPSGKKFSSPFSSRLSSQVWL